ncbi:MAG: hypothetical protein KatS3mg057_2480 [Herpetosiphonaceae bacterium]|nr:MAG: hypothetical protein KatS3mg057_2480 [Herpetosiphonaceae bacterium]
MQTKQSNKMRSPDRRTRRLPYLPGLDGLRALAVIAVLLYHTNLNLRGGFLGVEVFFVLSGFLITSLLLSEWRQHGRIDLRMFWLRRARRLFPALVLVLLGTTILASLLPSTEIEGLEGYLAAAFGYVMNWYLIADQQSYFTPLVRPPLLQHLWSLAIEEQFYLIWPLLLLFGMRFLRSAGLLLATLTLAAGSLALTVFFYQPGADPSRIYYGTDTRAFGLLTGAVLALLWAPAHPPFSDSRTAGLVLDILGIAALAGLIASCIWLYDQHPRLYQGGLAGVSLGTAVAIASISHPQARLISGLIGCRPLRWIGIRSYGIYLWHWPIFMLTRPGLDIPLTGWPLTVVRVGIVVALAALSYRFVEMPIRQGRFGLPAWIGRLGRRAASALRRMPGRGTAASAATIKAPIQGGRKRSAGRSPGMSMGWLYGLIIVTLPAAITACALQTSKPPNAGPIVIIPPTAITPTATPTMAAAATPIPNEMAAAATPTTSETPTAGLPSPTVAPPTPTELPAFDPALEATLQAILDQAVASGEIPGVVAAVSIPGHQPWVGASGLADVRQAQPMTPDTGNPDREPQQNVYGCCRAAAGRGRPNEP